MRKNNTAIIFGGLFFSCSVMAGAGTLAPTVVPMVNGGKYLFGIGAAVLVYFGIKKLKKGRGSSWLRDLIYWYMPTALLRGIFHNVPDSCFRQWIK